MKKLISKSFLIISFALLIWPSLLWAQTANLTAATPVLIQKGSLYEIIGILIQTLLGFVGVLFLVMVIYGGVIWMTAGGDTNKIGKARDIIVKATIGIVIIMSSYAIVYTVIYKLIT